MARFKRSSTVLSQSTAVQVPAVTKQKVRGPLLKRPLDITLSILMLILSLPVSLIIAMAIKLEDRGAVFYRQERLSISALGLPAIILAGLSAFSVAGCFG